MGKIVNARSTVPAGQTTAAIEGLPVDVKLSGSSPGLKSLMYNVVSQPLNGALSGAPPNLTYTPGPN